VRGGRGQSVRIARRSALNIFTGAAGRRGGGAPFPDYFPGRGRVPHYFSKTYVRKKGQLYTSFIRRTTAVDKIHNSYITACFVLEKNFGVQGYEFFLSLSVYVRALFVIIFCNNFCD